MALTFKTENAAQNQLNALRQLTDLFSKDETKKNMAFQTQLNTIGSEIFDSFDDVSYESNINALNEYYTRNLNKFDETTIEHYLSIKDNAERHKERYSTFDGQFAILDNIGRGVISSIEKYNEAPDEDKEALSQEMVANQIDYITQKERMIKTHGDFFTHPSNKFVVEANRMGTYDSMFTFALDSIEEDDETPFFVDKYEFKAIREDIISGTTKSTQQYVDLQAGHLEQAAKSSQNTGKNLIFRGNLMGEVLDKRDYAVKLLTDAGDTKLPSDVRNEAQLEFNELAGQQAFLADPKLYPNLPNTYAQGGPITYQELAGGIGQEIDDIFRDEMNVIEKELSSAESTYSNTTMGQSLFDIFTPTYSKWQDRTTEDWMSKQRKMQTPGDKWKKEAPVKKDNIKAGDNIPENVLEKVEVYSKDTNEYNKAIEWLKANPMHLDNVFTDKVNKAELRDIYWALKAAYKKKYKKTKEVQTITGKVEKSGFEEISDLVNQYPFTDLPSPIE